MSYTSRTRDRFRVVIMTVTGVTTVGALSLTGWLAGVMGQEYAAEQAESSRVKAADQAAWEAAARKAARQQAAYDAAVVRQNRKARPQVVLLQRPQRTRVTLRYSQAASAGGSVGPGGTVTSSSAGSGSAPAAAAPTASGAQPAPAPPPPPPPPAPAPTSGS